MILKVLFSDFLRLHLFHEPIYYWNFLNKADGKMARDSAFKPLYKILSDKIGEEIIRLNLQSGDFYCTLKDLCSSHSLSIITARKAVTLLEEKGILTCKSSSGIYVANRESLNTLNAFSRLILIPHHHRREKINSFFELRLSSMLQTFAGRGYMALPIYREELNREKLELMSGKVRGIVGGNTLSAELAAMKNTAPLLLINPPAELEPSPNICTVRYNRGELLRLSAEYIRRRGAKSVLQILTDPAMEVPEENRKDFPPLRQIAVPPVDHEETAVETGRRLAAELAGQAHESFFWITDDFVAMGFCEELLRHGIDPLRERRILANASPSMALTEELGLPVIGFCPMKIGHEAAGYFCDYLSASQKERSTVPLFIDPAPNANAGV